MIFKEVIRGLQKVISQKIEKSIATLILRAQVTDVYEENGKLYIKANSILDGSEISEIKLISSGLGNGRGIIVYPKIGDIGLVINALGECFYLGSMYDEYTSAPDNQILKDKKSYFIINNSFGSYIALMQNNDIIIKTKTGAKMKLYETGAFKLFNKGNFGIEVDSNGVLTLRGTNLDTLLSGNETNAGSWDSM